MILRSITQPGNMCVHMEENRSQIIYLYPVPPYNFHISASIFRDGDPEVRIYENGIYYQAIQIKNNYFLIMVKSPGTVEKPIIEVAVVPENNCNDDIIIDIIKQVSQIFSISDNLLQFYSDLNSDPVMASLSQLLFGLKFPTTPTIFEALVDSIIEQQISLSVARQLQYRLIKRTGHLIKFDKSNYFCYPVPFILANTPVHIYRECGLTTRKSEYIIGVSQMIADHKLDIEKFKSYSDINQIIDEMCSIRVIGRWTAELTILRGMHRTDAFPAADIALRRMVSKRFFHGEKISTNEVRDIGERMGKWKGFAAAYLEFAELLDIP